MDYNARFYSPSLGRFISADTVIPGARNPMAWDRFSYVQNNPLRYIDPSGHIACELVGECTSDDTDGALDSESDVLVPEKEEWDQVAWEAAGVRFDVDSGLTDDHIDQIIYALNLVRNVLGSRTLAALGLGNGRYLKFIFIFGRSKAPVGEVHLNIQNFTVTQETIVHELGHVVDYNAGPGGINLYTTSSGCSKNFCKPLHNVWRWNTGWDRNSDGTFTYNGEFDAASTGYGLNDPILGPS